MAAPTPLPSKAPSSMDEDHVTWQSSQRCQVLSRLMVSAEKQLNRESSPAEGWSPSSPPSPYRYSTVSSPYDDIGQSSSRRPLSRARTSEGNIEPCAKVKSTNSERHSPIIPFFDKGNPARFFALLKGVSTRVDENAGVRSHDVAGPSGMANSVAECKRKRIGQSPVAKRARLGRGRMLNKSQSNVTTEDDGVKKISQEQKSAFESTSSELRKANSEPSSTPRPPPLGMRRTYTLPNYGKRKTFKPPLLSVESNSKL